MSTVTESGQLNVLRALNQSKFEASRRTRSKTALNKAIDACGRLRGQVSTSTLVGGPTNRVVEVDGIAYLLIEQRRTLVNDVVEHSYLQDLANEVYPGALIQGEPLTKGDTAPILLPRAGGAVTIVTDMVSTNPGSQSRQVAKPSASSVGNARRKMLQALKPTDSAGILKASYEQAQTVKEGAAKVGVDVRGVGFSVQADASIDSEYKSTSIVAVIRQVYYSAAFDPDPSKPGAAAFLGPDVTAAKLKPFAWPGNPPLYVSTVHYGRALVITATAKASRSELEGAIKAQWGAIAAGGTVDLSARQKEVLDSAQVRVFAVGAVGDTLPTTLTNPVADLDAVYRKGLKFSVNNPGGPIAFTARHIADGSLAHVGLTASYTQPVSAEATDVRLSVPVWDGPGGGPVSTGVRVAPGDHVEITASGSTWSGVWGAGAHGPNGWMGWKADSSAPLPGEDIHAVIARFGPSQYFKVGSFWEGTNTTGSTKVLELNINDNNPYNGDPNQRFTVTVSVRRRPASQAGIYV
jgi:hypothetical protein